MRLAIMQPYFFPYVGYFQLLHAADTFVVYDDVQYMKGGWINRNQILGTNGKMLFTVPVSNGSPSARIHEVAIAERQMAAWWKKFRKTLEQAYRNAPGRDRVLAMLQDLVDAQHRDIASLNLHALRSAAAWLKLDVRIVPSSSVYGNDQLHGIERVLDICRQEQCTTYVNAPGGMALYEPAVFRAQNVDLRFVKSSFTPYGPAPERFVPGLSILDVMMNVGREDVQPILHAYELIEHDGKIV